MNYFDNMRASWKETWPTTLRSTFDLALGTEINLRDKRVGLAANKDLSDAGKVAETHKRLGITGARLRALTRAFSVT
jgi:hypothetical protein